MSCNTSIIFCCWNIIQFIINRCFNNQMNGTVRKLQANWILQSIPQWKPLNIACKATRILHIRPAHCNVLKIEPSNSFGLVSLVLVHWCSMKEPMESQWKEWLQQRIESDTINAAWIRNRWKGMILEKDPMEYCNGRNDISKEPME